MNYPTEFRIIDIFDDHIHMYMSNITSPDVNTASKDLLNDRKKEFPQTNVEVYKGNTADREIYINLPVVDTDGDGILDSSDNCINISNPGQGDHDNDGIGDVCEPCYDKDYNKDYKINFRDISLFSKSYGSYVGGLFWNSQSDFNKDGKVDESDISFFSSCYGKSW